LNDERFPLIHLRYYDKVTVRNALSQYRCNNKISDMDFSALSIFFTKSKKKEAPPFHSPRFSS